MNTPEHKDPLLAPLRELPTEVSLGQVEQMVAAFPLAMGVTAWIAHFVKFNLNTLTMTSVGTILLGTGLYLSLGQAQPGTPAPAAAEQAPVTVVQQPVPPAPPKPPVALAIPPTAVPAPEQPAEPPQPDPALEMEAPANPPVPVQAPALKAVRPFIAPAAPVADGLTKRADHAPAVRPGDEKRAFNASGFTQVVLNGSDDVLIKQGPFAVIAMGPALELDRVEVSVKGNVLSIGRKKDKGLFPNKEQRSVQVIVHMPQLDAASLVGSGDIRISPFGHLDGPIISVLGSGDLVLDGPVELDHMNLMLRGSGNINCPSVMVSGSTTINLLGSSDVTIAGLTGSLDITLNGSGDVHAARLKADSGSVSILGSGDVYLNSTTPMKTLVNGSGNVYR